MTVSCTHAVQEKCSSWEGGGALLSVRGALSLHVGCCAGLIEGLGKEFGERTDASVPWWSSDRNSTV